MKQGEAEGFRDTMIARIAERNEPLGLSLLPEVREAVRTVPRHLFTEGASLDDSYGDRAVVTNRDERGVSISSVSAPWLQAAMIGQARLSAGDRVLEIGSGGYNAALIREVVGAGGSVTSIDIDPAVTERADRCLAAAGYTDIEVICADAEHAIPGRRFDAIIVTVGAWDVSPAWLSMLADHGRLVVPIRTMGLTRSWALERDAGSLRSTSHISCGFVAMRGEGANRGHSVPLQEEPRVGLWCDEGQEVDADALAGVLGQPRDEQWTGITVAPAEQYSNQDLWLATRGKTYCQITATQEALDAGVVDLKWQYGQPAFVDGGTLAYRPRTRPVDEARTRYEFGVFAHGPESARAGQVLADEIASWDRAGRPNPVLSVHPLNAPDASLPEGFVLSKKHHRLVISWLPPESSGR
ncbi:methyltransferase, FxLD system [Kineosporia babensis]|uniref:Protein-L-isoaspartate O-methyltransferase n=1 Tax=Kineosporia babensis TaxID=499548 RepID=A0A9X1NAR9_9ACTN|nr:methyltransferase, FxLD system [Kineosporia babensis]